MLSLMGLGLALRLFYFSGFGLDDDQIFRGNIAFFLDRGYPIGDNVGYRLTWLLFSALSCKIFGLTEFGMIVPITATAILGIGLIYAFGKALCGRTGGLIAALLLVVHPMDVAWSTMLTNDILLSFFSALSIFLVLRAIDHEGQSWKLVLWILAGVSLWLAVNAKISAVLLAPVIAVICWRNRQRLGMQFIGFLGSVGILFGATLLTYYLFTGDALTPYHAELRFQGLAGPEASSHRITPDLFWTYPALLLFQDRLGDFLFSAHPHLLLVLAGVGRSLGIRTSREMFWWFLLVFLGMQFNVQRADGVWITGYRNIRHAHVLIFPLILLLTGYLAALRLKRPALFYAVIAVVLGFGGWQSVSTASKTHVAFADMREGCRFLATLPDKVVYADGKLPTWCTILEIKGRPWRFKELHSWDREKRRAEIAAITSGYLVTGGGREPHLGCRDCVVSADELSPATWRLVKEFPGPAEPTPWRLESLRVWEVKEVPDAIAGSQ
jgi:hypothetical protein